MVSPSKLQLKIKTKITEVTKENVEHQGLLFLLAGVEPRRAFCCSKRRSRGDGPGPLHKDDPAVERLFTMGPPPDAASAIKDELMGVDWFPAADQRV